MFEKNYVIVDLETTGLSPIKNEIIEIGAIKVENNKIVDKLDILVKPKEKVNYFITNLTGITNKMLESGVDIKDGLKIFTDFASDSMLIAHNAKFDLGFLNINLQKHFNCTLENKYLDTLALSRQYVKGVENYKLETLANYFDINYVGAHRSLKDCEITFELCKNIEKLYNESVKC